MSSASLRLLTGRQDHLGPCLLLQVSESGSKVTAEYLFGLGENAPRAMLEHRARPQRCLRATFAPTLDCHSIGGLGSLILRLRDDGHGKVSLHLAVQICVQICVQPATAGMLTQASLIGSRCTTKTS